MAAVTNCHKFSGLRQHRLIILQFWRSEIPKSSCHRAALLLETRRESVSLPFPACTLYLHSLAHGPFLHLQSQQHIIFQSLSHFLSCCCREGVHGTLTHYVWRSDSTSHEVWTVAAMRCPTWIPFKKVFYSAARSAVISQLPAATPAGFTMMFELRPYS